MFCRPVGDVLDTFVAQWLGRWCTSLVAQFWFRACPIQRQLLQGGKPKWCMLLPPTTFSCTTYNFTRKQPRKKQPIHLTPTFYGLPNSFHTLKIKDLYQNLAFKTPDQIFTLTGTRMIPLKYSNLKAHVTQFIGHNKKYDAVVKEILPQKEHTSSNTTDFIRKATKGSGTIRKIISRRHTRADIHNPKRWPKN